MVADGWVHGAGAGATDAGAGFATAAAGITDTVAGAAGGAVVFREAGTIALSPIDG